MRQVVAPLRCRLANLCARRDPMEVSRDPARTGLRTRQRRRARPWRAAPASVGDVRRIRLNWLRAAAWPAAFVAAMLAGAACTSQRPYRIGVVLGTDGLRAAHLAVDEVNARGGIGGGGGGGGGGG